MKNNANLGKEHSAFAKALNLPISTKHSIEISKYLRHRNTEFAKNFLQDVVDLKKAVPFKTFKHNVGHKAGMAAGRFPQKAAKEFLSLVKSVEANAQMKGLNSSSLRIIKLLANKASVPFTGGRHRRGTKRTHLEIEVQEIEGKKKVKKEKAETKEAEKEVKAEQSSETASSSATPTGQKNETASAPVEEVPEKEVITKKDEPKVEVPPKTVEETPVVEDSKPEEKEIVKEEPKEIVPEVEKKTEVIEKAVPEQEVVVKKEEPKEVAAVEESVKEVELKKEEPKEVVAAVETEKKETGEPEAAEAVAEETSPVKQIPETDPKNEVKEDISKKANGKEKPAEKEFTPEELLKKAQQKAAEVNKKEKVNKENQKEVGEVEDLFEKLKQKGSLRDQKGEK